MGETRLNKMRFFWIWLKVKLNKIINSKPFIFLLGIIIGATFLYVYLAGTEWYSWMKIGYAYANSTPYVSEVKAADPVGEKVFDKETGEISSELSPQSIINRYDWDKKVAYAVAKAESNLKTDAYNENTNGSWDAGLFQINSVHGHTREAMENPEANVAAAYEIYVRAGRQFTPWVVYNKGFYKNELN